MPRKDTAPSQMNFDTEKFSRRLYKLMADKKMSQSDVARAIWGTRDDPRGYKVARNRDRISAYLKGKSYPSHENLEKLAALLGVTPDELAPDLAVRGMDSEEPDLSITAIAGHHDKVMLRVSRLVAPTTAMEIMALLEKDPFVGRL